MTTSQPILSCSSVFLSKLLFSKRRCPLCPRFSPMSQQSTRMWANPSHGKSRWHPTCFYRLLHILMLSWCAHSQLKRCQSIKTTPTLDTTRTEKWAHRSIPNTFAHNSPSCSLKPKAQTCLYACGWQWNWTRVFAGEHCCCMERYNGYMRICTCLHSSCGRKLRISASG